MKCLNMGIPGILFFLANLIAVHTVDVQQNKPTRTQVGEELFINKLNKTCPNVLEFILANKLEDYTVNCKPFPTENVEVNVVNVLQNACWLAKSLLNFMSESRLDVSPDFFKQGNDTVCPFNFSHLEQYRINVSNGLVTELTKPDHCSKVCCDLYSLKPQCSVLGKLNRFLKSLNQSVSPKTTHPVRGSDALVSTTPQKKELGKSESITDKATKIKSTSPVNEIIPMKDDLEKLSKEDGQIYNSETKSEPQIEPKSETRNENEDLNEDGVDDDVSPIEEAKPEIPSIQVMKNSENKLDFPPSGKEIFAGEGFFQAEDSHFFFYFIMISLILVAIYLVFHNKNKILAYALEGSSGRRSRRRPNPAKYRKLETNLEEVISSNATNTAASSVVY